MAFGVVLLLLAGFLTQLARSATITIGGEEGWTLGPQYGSESASVGDSLVFNYAKGQHNVVQLTSGSCDALSTGVQLAGLAASPYQYGVSTAGNLYFACSVPGHCEAGMLVTVTVEGSKGTAATPAIAPAAALTTGTATSPSGTTSTAPQQSALALDVQQHPGHCEQPIADTAMPGYSVATCYSPGITMGPGDVVNSFYVLPNPYPINEDVAVVKQTSRVVDENGRDVPLSEAYVHHFFGNANLLLGEGSELRGTITDAPIPLPYYTQVNGSVLQPEVPRAVNVHLINTIGVQQDDLYPCIECWCREQADIQAGYAGGTGCCTPLNCPTSADPTVNHTYYLEYNVTYRSVSAPYQAQGLLQPYLMDYMNGSIEHDIHRGLPGSSVNVSQSGAIDSRCPQSGRFSLARCITHQHIGGQCIELRHVNGSTICRSCPTYGTAPTDDAGNELGYVVKIAPQELSPPVTLEPGSLVEMVSTYDSGTDHFGVMSLLILYFADWDPSCPGPQAELAFGPRQDQDTDAGDYFGLFEGKGFNPKPQS